MTTRIECPPDEDLWPLAFDEPCDEGLRGHADACDRCRGRIARLRAEVAAIREIACGREGPGGGDPTTYPWGLPDPEASTVTSDKPGHPATIGRYTVIGVLDEGGQAVVYRVVHRELRKELVLKLAKRPLLGPSDRSELVDEGRILVELDHPSMVRIYDLDFHRGRAYLVMEYVAGMNLAQWAEHSRPGPGEAARVVARLARAAMAAHRRGVIHRDIKPKNALIDQNGRPRLIDFGMANLRDAWSDRDEGPRGGTVAFMAPEQAQGQWDRIGPAVDVFALGAVLYFLLTGEAPYRGPDLGAVLERARKCDYDIGPLRARVIPGRLRQICQKAMAADPAERYSTAEELADRLEAFARGRRLSVSLLAVGSAGILGASAMAWWPSPAPRALDGRSVHELHDLLRVRRGNEVFGKICDSVSLQTGDRIRVRCDVPSGLGCSMFWLDADGNAAELTPFEHSPGDLGEELAYPGKGLEAPLAGSLGTELVVICGSESGPVSLEEFRKAIGASRPLPALPSEAIMLLDRDEVVEHYHRGLGSPEPSRFSEIHKRLDQLRLALRDRCSFLAGAALTHREPRVATPSRTTP